MGSIRCNTQVSTCFQLLHGVRKVLYRNLVYLVGHGVLNPFTCIKSCTLEVQLHLREKEVVAGRQICRVWGVVQCWDLFFCQKPSNYCCRNLSTVFVSSNLLLKSVEPQFSGCRMYLLLTETSLFDLFWPLCWRRRCFHRFDLLWVNHCVHRPSLTLYPLKTFFTTQKLLFDLMLHHRKPPESVPHSL
jgi:hypothetical protein